jgi:effector-associated domain 1 (EAD1)-containing protein
MSLAPKLHRELRAALEDAFPNPDHLDTFLLEHFGRDLNSFAPRTLARPELYSQLITRIGAEGLVREFIDQLHVVRPDNALVQGVWQRYQMPPPDGPLIPHLGGERDWRLLVLGVGVVAAVLVVAWFLWPKQCDVWGRHSVEEFAAIIDDYWKSDTLSAFKKEYQSKNGCVAITGTVASRNGNAITLKTQKWNGTALRVFRFEIDPLGSLDNSISTNVQVKATGKIAAIRCPDPGQVSGAVTVVIKEAVVTPQ